MANDAVDEKVFHLYRETTDDKIDGVQNALDKLERKVDCNHQETKQEIGELRKAIDVNQKDLIAEIHMLKLEEKENATWKKVASWGIGIVSAVVVFIITKLIGL